MAPYFTSLRALHVYGGNRRKKRKGALQGGGFAVRPLAYLHVALTSTWVPSGPVSCVMSPSPQWMRDARVFDSPGASEKAWSGNSFDPPGHTTL